MIRLRFRLDRTTNPKTDTFTKKEKENKEGFPKSRPAEKGRPKSKSKQLWNSYSRKARRNSK